MPSALSTSPPGIIDVEASGFGRASYPIEVGYVLPDGSSFCCLIRPLPQWTHWDSDAEQVHRISQATLLEHGRAAAEVAGELNRRLHGLTLYCDGWAHDYTWVATLFEATGLVPRFRIDNLRSLLTEGQAATFDALKRRVAAEMDLPRHRASSDARTLQRTLILLRAGHPA